MAMERSFINGTKVVSNDNRLNLTVSKAIFQSEIPVCSRLPRVDFPFVKH